MFKVKGSITGLLLSSIVLVMACQPPQKKANTVEPGRLAFDALEGIFETGNWQTILDGDTTYLFFSREAPALVNVYFYQMRQGDSVNTFQSQITATNDTIQWNWPGASLKLLQADSTQAKWRIAARGNDQAINYLFSKKDSMVIHLQVEPGEEHILRRTLPISAFLVRSKYDFQHGTQYAADTVEHRTK